MHTQSRTNRAIYFASAVCLLAALGISFYSGMLYQKQSNDSSQKMHSEAGLNTALSAIGQHTEQEASLPGQGPIRGAVTSISNNSVTILNDLNNTTMSYGISAETLISQAGVTKSLSDIQQNSTVLIIPDTTNTTHAAKIVLNPTLGVNNGTGEAVHQ